MDWLLLVGRIDFVLVFVMSGLTLHLINWRQGVAYAAQYRVPALLVPLSGIVAVSGGVLIALGVWADLGALLIAVFAFVVAPWMHAFWKEADPMMRANQQAHFMKNISMGGGALGFLYLFQQFGDEIGLVIGPAALFD